MQPLLVGRTTCVDVRLARGRLTMLICSERKRTDVSDGCSLREKKILMADVGSKPGELGRTDGSGVLH
jgi:hypothetical protein